MLYRVVEGSSPVFSIPPKFWLNSRIIILCDKGVHSLKLCETFSVKISDVLVTIFFCCYSAIICIFENNMKNLIGHSNIDGSHKRVYKNIKITVIIRSRIGFRNHINTWWIHAKFTRINLDSVELLTLINENPNICGRQGQVLQPGMHFFAIGALSATVKTYQWK